MSKNPRSGLVVTFHMLVPCIALLSALVVVVASDCAAVSSDRSRPWRAFLEHLARGVDGDPSSFRVTAIELLQASGHRVTDKFVSGDYGTGVYELTDPAGKVVSTLQPGISSEVRQLLIASEGNQDSNSESPHLIACLFGNQATYEDIMDLCVQTGFVSKLIFSPFFVFPYQGSSQLLEERSSLFAYAEVWKPERKIKFEQLLEDYGPGDPIGISFQVRHGRAEAVRATLEELGSLQLPAEELDGTRWLRCTASEIRALSLSPDVLEIEVVAVAETSPD